MHELSLAESILPAVLETAAAHGADRVTKVFLSAGALQQIVVPSLQLCFEAVCVGTLAAGAELVVEVVPVVARCRQCGLQFPVEDFCFVCPDCQLASAETIQGDALVMTQVELETCESTSSTTS